MSGQRLRRCGRAPRRRSRHVDMQDVAPIVGEDDEDEQDPAGERRDREEVDRDRRAEMVGEERAPALRGWPPPTRHQPRNGPLGDVEPQLQQFPMDARRAPEGVRDGHLLDQTRDVSADLWPAAARTRSACPVPREAEAMPGNDRRGSDDHQGRFPVRPRPSQSDPKKPIGPTNGGLRSGAPVNSQLLLQRQVLEDQGAVAASENDQQSNNVDEPGDHWFSITGSAHRAAA